MAWDMVKRDCMGCEGVGWDIIELLWDGIWDETRWAGTVYN